MSTRQRLIVGIVLTIALGFFVGAYWLRGDDSSDLAVTSNAALEELIPQRETEILRQDQVGIDLAPEYSGRLSINGVEIPVDESDITEALNLVIFRPGPGKVFEALEDGRNCATGTYWKTRAGPDQAETVVWCFEVT